MRNYEITAIIKDGSVEETKNTIKEILAKNSINLTAEEDWGVKTVWHPIGKEINGHFAHYKCSVDRPISLIPVENDFKLNQNILRSMIVRL